MSVFLALLLVMSLPRVETNVTVTGKQQTMKCHSCEKENDFTCVNPIDCPSDTEYCSTAAVRLFPRFFFVSKQCVKYCPISMKSSLAAKSFVLEKPMPFIYVSCCRRFLCNAVPPNVSEYREAGRAPAVRGSSAGRVLFLGLSSVSLGPRLS